MFAAIFFVAVGMLIDPAADRGALGGRGGVHRARGRGQDRRSSASGAFLAGYGTRTSVQAGMSLAQIGEFSFIIAGIGLASGATGDFLYPVAVAVSAITTLTTPWLIRAGRAGRVMGGSQAAAAAADLRRALRIVDGERCAAVRATSAAGHANGAGRAAGARRRAARRHRARRRARARCRGRRSHERTELAPEPARLAVLAGAAALAAPLAIGLLRTAAALGQAIALRALPAPTRGVDLGAAPRRALPRHLAAGDGGDGRRAAGGAHGAVPPQTPGHRGLLRRAGRTRDRVLAQRHQPSGPHPGRGGNYSRGPGEADGGKRRGAGASRSCTGAARATASPAWPSSPRPRNRPARSRGSTI